ncbi:hypothetical protein [Shimia sagamensis]|uniref:Uncharacterized protein n=1 Tax=Shimia sagamensis TaxID=1566352 RepID=A0ABY1NZU1_9RHOB|nr:hypothetical protein [Shimia sagamensis]SMP21912.1 hypothetical protein SAMN06265373_10460 [Shimia sagamensis]
MFEIRFNDILLGTSKLESGDPPMGCVEGVVTPSEHFDQFAKGNLPHDDGDPAIKRWSGLRIFTSAGLEIDAQDAVLMAIDFGSEVELRVDALGIPSGQYEAVFPNHWKTYESQFT